MGNNKVVKLAAFLLIAFALTTCTISTTFAKYVSESTGTDSARVAKWDIKLNGAAWSDTTTFNLFTYTDNNVDVNGLADDTKVIAPGTTGSFTFSVENDSEVAAKYSINLAVTNANDIPIEFQIGNGEWVKADQDGKVVVATDQAIAMGAAASTVTVNWRWAFTGAQSTNYTTAQTDATDTTLGEAGTATVSVTATINAEQVD